MTTTTTRRPVVKTLADFEHRGLIGRWFGDLQLIAVKKPAGKQRGIGETLCRVACAQGHPSSRPWWELRDQNRKRICARCQPRKPPTNISGDDLQQRIAELSPERRRLFVALMDSRRRVAGEQDATPREILNDAYSYATNVMDPQADLEELTAQGERELLEVLPPITRGLFEKAAEAFTRKQAAKPAKKSTAKSKPAAKKPAAKSTKKGGKK